jgi:elongation factor G
MEAYLEGNEPDEATLKKLIRKGTLTSRSCRCSAARPSRTRACSRCSTPSSTTCRRRSTFPPYQGHRPTPKPDSRKSADDASRSRAGVQDHERPVRRLAHLLPHLFGQARRAPPELGQGQEGARRPHAADARQQPRGHQGSLRRRHRRAGRPEGHHHRRHAVRSEKQAVILERMEFPSRSSRSRSSRRPRPTRKRWASRSIAWRRRPVLPRLDRPGIGPDHHQGHGRTSPRHQGRPHEARVQGRGQCRRAAGGLSRDDLAKRWTSTTPTRSRPAVRASSPASRSPFEPGEPGGLRLRRRSGGNGAEGIHPGVEKGIRETAGNRPLIGFPIIDFKAPDDGAYHDVDSSVLAFEIAPAPRCAKLRRRPASSCSSRS